MTATALDHGPRKVAASVWKAARWRPAACVVLVDIPQIVFAVNNRSFSSGGHSLADIALGEYDDTMANRLIEAVATEVERTTHVRPVVLKSSATIRAEMSREQLERIAELDAVKRIGPDVGFAI